MTATPGQGTRTPPPGADDVAWEPLQVPSMDSIRALVAREGSPHYPRRRDWRVSREVFGVVENRWRQAVRELCTHPHGFPASLATNLLGETRYECPRCYASPPAEEARDA